VTDSCAHRGYAVREALHSDIECPLHLVFSLTRWICAGEIRVDGLERNWKQVPPAFAKILLRRGEALRFAIRRAVFSSV
jgi:hypothetical protein